MADQLTPSSPLAGAELLSPWGLGLSVLSLPPGARCPAGDARREVCSGDKGRREEGHV